nr:T9SS type A sorting domain-containing protein [uncultured Carboxylicivirga sp.]
MKRSVVLFFGLAFMAVTFAEKPLSKKNSHKKSLPSILLKSVTDDYQPLYVITDCWDGSTWGDPLTTSYTYNEYGFLWISESESERITYTYGDDNKLLDKIKESFVETNWVNDYKYSYTYDDYGILCQKCIYYWDGTDWVLSDGSWVERFYDSFGKLIGEISYYYDFPDGWIEIYGYKTEYVYVDGLLAEQTEYDRFNGEWIASWKYDWTYNDFNLLNGGLEYYFDGSRFTLSGRYVDVIWYFWNPEGHVQSSYVESYTYQAYNGPAFPREEPDNDSYYEDIERLMATYPDGDGGGTPPTTIETYQMYKEGWINDFRWTWLQMQDYESELDEIWSQSTWLKYYYTMDYQTNLLKYNITESYSYGVLSKATKESEIFDGFGNITETKTETKSDDGDWIQKDGDKWIYSYDGGSSKILSKTYQDWDDEALVYVNDIRERFFYYSTNLESLSNENIVVYPTVLNSDLFIQSDVAGKMSLYNIGGVNVLNRPVYSGINLINCFELKRGLYIIKISTRKGVRSFKVLKQ